MAEKENLFYYKRNVAYSVGVRLHMGDSIGKVLNGNDPYVAIVESALRDFKRANRQAIEQGLIVTADEPNVDWETPNMIDDLQAAEVVKNVFTLKKVLKEVTAPEIVQKLLAEAEKQDRPIKTIQMIQKRLDEMKEDSPFAMRGVENDYRGGA